MKAKPLDKMTKPELVKALKAAHKRIAKLEAQLAGPVTNAEIVARQLAVFPWENK